MGIHDRPTILQVLLSHTAILADRLLIFSGKDEIGDEIIPALRIRDLK